VWGWGGDPYDPSFLLSLFLTDQIGGNSDSFYSNPEYDRLFNEQAGAFDVAERKRVIAEMVNLTQEDLPYIVLTEDPNLQAYRTDRLSNVEQTCPADETGDLFCEQISYEPLLSLTPADSSSDSDDGGGGGVIIAVIAAAVIAVAGFLFWRSRRRREGEPLELEE
jgi:peptide/nickel transport system substrate-binding protein